MAIGTRGTTGALVAAAMLFSSTGAFAATLPAAGTQTSPWASLSVMSGGAAAMQACGAAAGAAATAGQPAGGCVLPQADVPPPMAQVPVEAPPMAVAPAAGISPLLLGLVAVAAAVGLYLLTRANRIRVGNSPA